MNEADLKVKQQIVDKIKSSTNILVTVSKDPSVDELSAALGLATILNKIDKHATAIFSGAVPPAITFLNPDNVFESSADSLRDFIIALDKEKADHLRYKVEGDVVKIFITPYRTVITGDDLEFSQGDFNIELVLALGVENQDNLDTALAAHGRILHDVTVATLSAGQQVSSLGSLDWRDDSASSLCEMVAGIGEALKSEKPLLDKQISTALLTGIVAATDRFSNTRTTSRVMTIAAQLMAAGADQQLIAAKLQESHEIKTLATSPAETESVEPQPQPSSTEAPDEQPNEQSTLPPDGSLAIDHAVDTPAGDQFSNTFVEPDASTYTESTLPEALPLPQPEPIDYSNSTLADAYAPVEPEVVPVVEPAPVIEPTPEPVVEVPQPSAYDGGVDALPHEKVIQPLHSDIKPDEANEPMLGGTLNATADQAAEEARRAIEEQQNTTILTHSYLGGADGQIVQNGPMNGLGQIEDPKDVDIFAAAPADASVTESGLPLPPPAPQFADFSTMPPPPLPDFGASAFTPGTSTFPQTVSSDPSQFRIPGQ
ncbi:MAG: hypothetical protein WCH58_04000 [Candidatus Saccharibacteria bacterium]